MGQIEKAIIRKVEGRIKAFTGEGLRLEGFIEDRGTIPLICWRREFPAGVIEKFLIGGPEVDVIIHTHGDTTIGVILPFANQGPELTTVLMTALLKRAEAKGQRQLNKLPFLERPKPNPLGGIPLPMDARVEKLNSLLEEEIPEPDLPPEEPPF